MKPFGYYQPTEIRFGRGCLEEVGEVVSRFGKRCLLVTVPEDDALARIYARAKQNLTHSGIEFEHFDGVIPNPTTEVVSAGADLAKEFGADVIVGLGGGSSMDTAKAIAVEAVHPGTSWDYLHFRDTQPTAKTLPVVAVSTTSGTGSQVTQVAVVTNPDERNKSAIYNPLIFPRVCIIDPELMITVPKHVTASTGFDVFCHAFESTLHPKASAYTDLLAWEAVGLVAEYLPAAIEDGFNIEVRTRMAWADTLAGLCIANAGVTLPHGIGMAIGGQCPHVSHGQALAVVYPEFMRYTSPNAVGKFAHLGGIFDPRLRDESLEVAAERSCEEVDRFLKKIGMWLSLEGLKIAEEEIAIIAERSLWLPDYQNNPRIATRDEVEEILRKSYSR